MESNAPLNPSKSGRFDAIDSFRGLAALSVVGSHLYSGFKNANFPSADAVNHQAGDLLSYIFYGSSSYFMIITGFILAAKLPEWKRHPDGLLFRAVQRITKIVIIYWIALVLIMTINMLRYSMFGTAWYNADLLSTVAQFLFFSNYLKDPLHFLAPGWYLEADFVIFITLIACYFMWNRLPGQLQQRLRPAVFLATIAVVFICVYQESLGPSARGLQAPIRLLTYFVLGFLAWHARNYATAMFALIVNSMLILIWNDQSVMHRYFYSSNAIIVAFIFYFSHYSKTLAVLASQPLIVKLYKINFGIFLFNLFVITLGFSIARHFAPNSVPGLIGILGLTLAGLFLISYLFTRYIQRPVLTWHDEVWKRMLTPIPKQKQELSELPFENEDDLVSPEPVRSEMA